MFLINAMILDKIPKVFFNIWLWVAIVAGFIAIHYFFGKPPPPPKKYVFFEKHKRTITRTVDIFLILVMLFGWVPLIYFAASMALEPFLNPPSIPIPPPGALKFAIALFSIGATAMSGRTGVLFGCLSIFQSNLTKLKRLILLVVSVLPIGFTILVLATTRFDKSEVIQTMKMGLGSLVDCWLFNGSAIIAGQHFIRVAWALLCKLRLASGDYHA